MNGTSGSDAAPGGRGAGTDTGPPVIEAVVVVDGEETSYLRSGQGEPTIVVVCADAAERRRLLRLLSSRHRVIAPWPVRADAAGTADGRACWLTGVVDGLGLDRPVVVLSADSAYIAAALTPIDQHRLGGILAGAPDAILVEAVSAAATVRGR